jgi:hypothetical protein
MGHRLREQIERWVDIQGEGIHQPLHLLRPEDSFTGIHDAIRIGILHDSRLQGAHPGGITLIADERDGAARQAHPFISRAETDLEHRLGLERQGDAERIRRIAGTGRRH